MWILPLIGYVGLVLGFGFLVLAIGMPLRRCTPKSVRCTVLLTHAVDS